MSKLVYLNYQAAVGGIPHVDLPEVYRAAACFFHCGIVDRTRAFPAGPGFRVLDPIEQVYDLDGDDDTFPMLCDGRAAEIVSEATAHNRHIQVLWSGGIDSTAALVALVKQCQRERCLDLLEVCLSVESIREYPLFYHEHLRGALKIRPLAAPVSDHLDVDNLIVTGEHGDQLFGSHHLQEHVETGLAFVPWKEALPIVAMGRLRTMKHSVGPFLAAIEPVMASCPVPVVSLFDFFWWANLSLKWQTVALRIPVSTDGRVKTTFASMRNFFQTPTFQAWSIFRRPRDRFSSWTAYKMPAKEYIHSFTGDSLYLRNKTKELSLREIFDGEKETEVDVPEAPDLEKKPQPEAPGDPHAHASPRRIDEPHVRRVGALYMTEDFQPRWIAA